jgi:hypothetical protein
MLKSYFCLKFMRFSQDGHAGCCYCGKTQVRIFSDNLNVAQASRLSLNPAGMLTIYCTVANLNRFP